MRSLLLCKNVVAISAAAAPMDGARYSAASRFTSMLSAKVERMRSVKSIGASSLECGFDPPNVVGDRNDIEPARPVAGIRVRLEKLVRGPNELAAFANGDAL